MLVGELVEGCPVPCINYAACQPLKELQNLKSLLKNKQISKDQTKLTLHSKQGDNSISCFYIVPEFEKNQKEHCRKWAPSFVLSRLLDLRLSGSSCP